MPAAGYTNASEVFASYYQQGYDIYPTIAITQAHINMPEVQDAGDRLFGTKLS